MAPRAHCLVLPYPTQGHINPMLQFSKSLNSKGVKVTLALAHSFKLTSSSDDQNHSSGNITVERISDGYDNGGHSEAPNTETYLAKFQEIGSQTLSELIGKIGRVDCIVYDAFLPWVLDVAKNFGLIGATYFTQSCAVDGIYYHVYNGSLELPVDQGSKKIVMEGLPELEPADLPYFLYGHYGVFPGVLDMVKNQFKNLDKADWVLCNSFYESEKQVADWMTKLWRFRTVGPAVPLVYMNERAQLEHETDRGLDMYKPQSEECRKWLDQRSDGSVVYVSFGSLLTLSKEDMEEFAMALKGSNKHFLWVVKTSEVAKLPKEFLEETSEKGLVVSWCSQMAVLAHRSIGCFVTHCGWNSVLEGLSLGVPMVATPIWTDQSTNAKFLEDVWGTGVRTPRDKEGRIRRANLEDCIRQVMDGEKGKEIKGNAIKWKELARKAASEGGSSDRNIDEFVTSLTMIYQS